MRLVEWGGLVGIYSSGTKTTWKSWKGPEETPGSFWKFLLKPQPRTIICESIKFWYIFFIIALLVRRLLLNHILWPVFQSSLYITKLNFWRIFCEQLSMYCTYTCPLTYGYSSGWFCCLCSLEPSNRHVWVVAKLSSPVLDSTFILAISPSLWFIFRNTISLDPGRDWTRVLSILCPIYQLSYRASVYTRLIDALFNGTNLSGLYSNETYLKQVFLSPNPIFVLCIFYRN